MTCRHCKKNLKNSFLDLGFAPPSNAYLSESDLSKPEISYPLQVMVCDNCWLVQTVDFVDAEKLFVDDYAYFSSTSLSWLEHAQKYSEKIINQLSLNANSFVIEIASNDGYLLRNFVEAKIPCLGIEPTVSTAKYAKNLGIPVISEFFGKNIADKIQKNKQKADLIIGNNVYAHVPDINDFTSGLKKILKSDGTITLEFAYLLNLIQKNEFDTIYHEHFSYLSLYAVSSIFEKEGLKIYDVELLDTHGGSLRVYGCHDDANFEISHSVYEQLQKEKDAGLLELDIYLNFHKNIENIKNDLYTFLLKQKELGKLVVGYGAAAKGNTLLNYAGIKKDLLPFVCDASPSKQDKFLPGSHIPIFHPNILSKEKPDYVLILPWNISDEIIKQLNSIPDWEKSYVIAIPELSII